MIELLDKDTERYAISESYLADLSQRIQRAQTRNAAYYEQIAWLKNKSM